MRNMMLIGKMNDILADLNKFLSDYFRVQIASESGDGLQALIKLSQPDIIVISLIGIYSDDPGASLPKVLEAQRNIPVITVGQEQEAQRNRTIYSLCKAENVTRPVNNTLLLEAICRILDISLKRLKEEAQNMEHTDGRKRILVVDDDPTMLKTIKMFLDDIYDVRVVPSGTKAVASMGKIKPDLVLLDYEMPVCDGRQTLEMIRSDEDFAKIPVVFLTGVSDRAHIEQVVALKPEGYLLKPPVKDKLRYKLGTILRV